MQQSSWWHEKFRGRKAEKQGKSWAEPDGAGKRMARAGYGRLRHLGLSRSARRTLPLLPSLVPSIPAARMDAMAPWQPGDHSPDPSRLAFLVFF